MDPASLDNQSDLLLILLKQLHLFQWVPVHENDVSQFPGFDGSKIFLLSEKQEILWINPKLRRHATSFCHTRESGYPESGSS